jgi:ParB-like chromosome segregation protein Spo0J
MQWKPVKRDLKGLKPQEKNPRSATKEQKKQLSKSLEKFGTCEPIVITKDGTIIGGHQRYYILKGRKEKSVDCMECQDNLDQEQIDELTIRLNKNTAAFDFDLLAGGYEAEKLLEWGFSMEELELESIPDQSKEPKLFQVTAKFDNEDDLRDAEDEIAEIVKKYAAASYKVKIK